MARRRVAPPRSLVGLGGAALTALLSLGGCSFESYSKPVGACSPMPGCVRVRPGPGSGSTVP
jgi:hypothetical protein